MPAMSGSDTLIAVDSSKIDGSALTSALESVDTDVQLLPPSKALSNPPTPDLA